MHRAHAELIMSDDGKRSVGAEGATLRIVMDNIRKAVLQEYMDYEPMNAEVVKVTIVIN